MKHAILAGALAALTVAAGGVALAQQAPAHPRTPHAMRADADGDGRISQAEFVGRTVERLTVVDANSDGSVAPEEMRAVAQARRAFDRDPNVILAKKQRRDVVGSSTDPALILAANAAYKASVTGAAETRKAAIDAARTRWAGWQRSSPPAGTRR